MIKTAATTAEATRVAMATLRATALVMMEAAVGMMVTAMAAVCLVSVAASVGRQHGNSVYDDNNHNNITPTQKPTRQPTREPTWRGLVGYSDFFSFTGKQGGVPYCKAKIFRGAKVGY